jgi:hypothetical protein
VTIEQPSDDTETAATADQNEAPRVPAGDDVRIGPDDSDEPQAGAAEPTD